MGLLNYWRSILWAFLSLIACILPSQNLPQMNKIFIPHLDKVVHFALFFILTLILLYESRLRETNASLGKRTIVWIVVITFIYGSFLEGMQHFLIASRSGELADLIANFLGVVAALLLYWFGIKLLASIKRDRVRD
ncbi:MAG: VanZ family protein [Bacteroidales bacterium]|nr:VanZ family protein [Bacteroidales bacterium]